MSHDEWESGTIVLPATEFASFRQAIQAADDAHKRRVFDYTQRFWKGLTRRQQTDLAAHKDAIRTWADAREKADRERPLRRWPTAEQIRADEEDQRAFADAYEMLFDRLWYGETAGKPSRVLQSEMKYPTNRTTKYTAGDANVTFDPERRTVSWNAHGNHAVERARLTWLARVFFDQVSRVRWKAGTGGVIAGNNESNMHASSSPGAGANYVTAAYGYLGVEQAPNHVKPFTNAKGERIGAQVKRTRDGRLVGTPVKLDRWGQPIRTAPPTSPGTVRAKTTARSTPGSFAPHHKSEADPSILE